MNENLSCVFILLKMGKKIHLYETDVFFHNINNKRKQKNHKYNLWLWSGWEDLNPRPHGPKPRALPDCATPRRFYYLLISSTLLVYDRFRFMTNPFIDK